MWASDDEVTLCSLLLCGLLPPVRALSMAFLGLQGLEFGFRVKG